MEALLPRWVRPTTPPGCAGSARRVTVTAYLVPQVMAYAELVGVPAEAGLWSVIGC